MPIGSIRVGLGSCRRGGADASPLRCRGATPGDVEALPPATIIFEFLFCESAQGEDNKETAGPDEIEIDDIDVDIDL